MIAVGAFRVLGDEDGSAVSSIPYGVVFQSGLASVTSFPGWADAGSGEMGAGSEVREGWKTVFGRAVGRPWVRGFHEKPRTQSALAT